LSVRADPTARPRAIRWPRNGGAAEQADQPDALSRPRYIGSGSARRLSATRWAEPTEVAAIGIAIAVVPGVALLAVAVWVWFWDPRPGSGLTMFPAAYLPGYSKGLSIVLGVAGLAWLLYLALALR
jgi:hypothetical protein